MPSSRWESERRRRVTRSMSAAEGMPSAPIAASCACTVFSRASNARASAPLTTEISDQLLSYLPQRLLALAGESVHEALIVVERIHKRRSA